MAGREVGGITNYEIDEGWLTLILAKNRHKRGFTANQVTRTVYDVSVIRECSGLYSDLVNTSKKLKAGPPIYLIGVTNHMGTNIDELLKKGYRLAAKLTNQPLLGYWIHETAGPFLDAVIADQFICEADAVRCGKGHEQDSILGIWQDGTHEIIKVV